MSFLRKINIYLIIQIFSVFAYSEAAFLCDPATDCSTRKVGDKVPDPDDCHNYYICIDSGGEPVPSDHYLTCADGMYFDQVTALCKTETGTCINACIKTCQTVCVADFDFIPDPDKGCSDYFVCIGGTPTPASCTDPTKQYFNGTGCSPNIYECCDVCAAYCFVANTQVRDPYDCTKYYLCTAGNTTPDETVHFTCSSGGFNPTTGVCDPSLTECTPYCDGAAPSATTTTPTTAEATTLGAKKINIKGDEAKPL